MRLSRVGGIVIAALVVPGAASAASEHINDRFGAAVAADGDRVAVGAPGDNSAAFDGGAVYVYVREGDGWVLGERVVAEDPEPEERFGTAVAVAGDTLAVASTYRHDVGATSVRIFQRGDGWQQVARVFGEEGAIEYGRAIAVAGDVVAVATGPRTKDGAARPGQVEVFHEGKGWDRVAALQGVADGGFEFGCGTEIALAEDVLVCIVPGQAWSDRGLSSGSRIAAFKRAGDEWGPGGDVVEPAQFGFSDVAFDGERLVARVIEFDEATMMYGDTTLRAYLRSGDGWSKAREIQTLEPYYPFSGTLVLAGAWLAFDSGSADVTVLHLEGDAWQEARVLPDSVDEAYSFDLPPPLALATGALWVGRASAASAEDLEVSDDLGEVKVYALAGEFAEVAKFDPEHTGERAGCRVDPGARAWWVWLALPGLAAWRRRRT